ncbi:spore germination protein [Peribacillus frigoritolerans]
MENIEKSLEHNIQHIKILFHQTSDLVVRRLKCGMEKSEQAAIIYIENIIDSETIQNYVIKPLLTSTKTSEVKGITNLISEVIEAAYVKTGTQYQELTDAIVNGNTVILFEGNDTGVIVETAKWNERSIEESIGERSPKGPVIGLTEKLKTNINILRSIIKSPELCVENKELGLISKTQISIIYMNGIVDKGVLETVQSRLSSLSVKYILEARIIDEVIEGQKSIFYLNKTTERPDVLASSIYEGKVGVIVDGTPSALITPSLFIDAFQTADDYYLKTGRYTTRFLRFMGFFLSVYLPAIYLTLEKFHQNELSKKVVKSLFFDGEIIPTFWEIMFLMFLVKILTDASFRIPKSAVILISLFGTLVIGELAVTAKILHPVSLIIVGLSFTSGFLVIYRGLADAMTILRFLFLLAANFFGFTGLIIGTTLLIIYMTNLKSAGVPYLSPLIPFRYKELKDTLYRGDLKTLLNSKHSYPDNK